MVYDPQHIASIWNVAVKFGLEDCAQLCQYQIEKYMTPAHALQILSSAHAIGLVAAKELARRYIKEHYEEVTVLPQISQLSQDLLIDLLRIPTKQFGPQEPLVVSKEVTASSASLKRDLRTLYVEAHSSEFADASFVIKERVFKVHRCMMIARNSVFAHMFTSGMQESQSRMVVLSDITENSFERLLEYLYCGTDQLQLSAIEEAIELLVLSDRFLLTGLREYCSRTIRSLLNPANAPRVLAVADQTGLVHLRVEALALISDHFSDLAANQFLPLLSSDLLVQIIQTHCARCHPPSRPTSAIIRPAAQRPQKLPHSHPATDEPMTLSPPHSPPLPPHPSTDASDFYDSDLDASSTTNVPSLS